jgi:hypothetical protein
MNILIIGTGWNGLHLAHKLQNEHLVEVVEAGQDIFQKASGFNQFRHHKGYHYPRSFNTRKMILDNSLIFENEYGFCLKDIESAYYGISVEDTNILDFETYTQIFSDDNYNFTKCGANDFQNISGLIKTDEKLIDTEIVSSFFRKTIQNIQFNRKIFQHDMSFLKRKYDLILDCTNADLFLDNCLRKIKARLLIYESTRPINFSLTIVDGPYFSIYPYKDNLFTVSDVIFSHQRMSLKKQIELTESKIRDYYPQFNEDFKFKGSFTSVKIQKKHSNAERTFFAKKHDNVVSMNSCKILSIYESEKYIRELI